MRLRSVPNSVGETRTFGIGIAETTERRATEKDKRVKQCMLMVSKEIKQECTLDWRGGDGEEGSSESVEFIRSMIRSNCPDLVLTFEKTPEEPKRDICNSRHISLPSFC